MNVAYLRYSHTSSRPHGSKVFSAIVRPTIWNQCQLTAVPVHRIKHSLHFDHSYFMQVLKIAKQKWKLNAQWDATQRTNNPVRMSGHKTITFIASTLKSSDYSHLIIINIVEHLFIIISTFWTSKQTQSVFHCGMTCSMCAVGCNRKPRINSIDNLFAFTFSSYLNFILSLLWTPYCVWYCYQHNTLLVNSLHITRMWFFNHNIRSIKFFQRLIDSEFPESMAFELHFLTLRHD